MIVVTALTMFVLLGPRETLPPQESRLVTAVVGAALARAAREKVDRAVISMMVNLRSVLGDLPEERIES